MCEVSEYYGDNVVLIDTWWNVNLLPAYYIFLEVLRFNRYMVECEYVTIAAVFNWRAVLIDTWWNVNSDHTPACGQLSTVLIDTWWNVNMFDTLVEYQGSKVLIDTWWNVN